METIIFATGNEGKLREIRMILGGDTTEVLSMKEAGFTGDIVENGNTFEENAVIKARAVMEWMAGGGKLPCDRISVLQHTPETGPGVPEGIMTMADDSGLEIDFLNRAPGVYSARFMGSDTSYNIKNAAILDKLSGVPREKRTARFVCAIACVLPDGRIFTSRGVMEGIIGYESRGANGFGYDPIFYLPEYGCSSAELSPEKKNELSHRGKALREMKRILRDNGAL